MVVQRKPCTYIAPTLTLFPNRPKWDCIWPTHLGALSGASKMISKPMVCSAQPSTYLASRLALPPNILKGASTWASSPRSTIGCVQNNFWAYGTFGANRASILQQDKYYVQTEWNELALEPCPCNIPGVMVTKISHVIICIAKHPCLSQPWCASTKTSYIS
jgi:hypothetical protein